MRRRRLLKTSPPNSERFPNGAPQRAQPARWRRRQRHATSCSAMLQSLLEMQPGGRPSHYRTPASLEHRQDLLVGGDKHTATAARLYVVDNSQTFDLSNEDRSHDVMTVSERCMDTSRKEIPVHDRLTGEQGDQRNRMAKPCSIVVWSTKCEASLRLVEHLTKLMPKRLIMQSVYGDSCRLQRVFERQWSHASEQQEWCRKVWRGQRGRGVQMYKNG
jgi:hypothetical protein